MIRKLNFQNNEHTWINIQADTMSELESLCDTYNIQDEVLAYAFDKYERAHIEFDVVTDTLMLIFNIPNPEKQDNHYETIPITFLVKNQSIITLSNSKNQYMIQTIEKYLKYNSNVSIYQFLFHCLFIITDSYFPFVEEMSADRKRISAKLKDKTTKQSLLFLSDLEIGIVYFETAAKQNVVLLRQLKNQSIFKGLDDIEQEQYEDVVIEAQQLVQMTQLSLQILQQLSGTYNNILNNNLNDTMRILTVLSILLTVPTIVTGFFGMNMPVPLENNAQGWIFAIIISLALWGVLSMILRKLIK